MFAADDEIGVKLLPWVSNTGTLLQDSIIPKLMSWKEKLILHSSEDSREGWSH